MKPARHIDPEAAPLTGMDPATLAKACPDVDTRLMDAHAARLDHRYFAAFDLTAVCRHLRLLARLTPEHPVEVWVESDDDGGVECTLLAFNYPAEFSLITGLLAGTGFQVESGQVFTYRPAVAPAPARRRPGQKIVADLWRRRRIVDFFRGRLSPGLSLASWSKHFTEQVHAVLELMEAGDNASVQQARHRVNERVAAQLGNMQATRDADMADALYPVHIDMDNAGPYTRLNVIGQDTPAFLYALSAALALRDIAIEGVTISTIKGAIHDQIDVLDGRGNKIEDADRLNQIRLSVLLTKQFTYFLGQAPDPYAALSRFELMCDDVLGLQDSGAWVDRLSDPRALSGLARLLGASDFIWEDFVRTHYETLAPMLASPETDSASTLDERFNAAMAPATTPAARQEALNAFKDREIFRIDLHHILQGNNDPRALAAALTRLAETVVRAAVDSVAEMLVQRHGEPRTVGGLTARHAVMGLGKFGGEALGYASDIEWLLVYSDTGETDGPDPISNAEFFGRLATESARFIRTKREGIFQVDLRLRPYGNSGPPACSLEAFCHYYGPGGDAGSYEHLALTRLRYVCGSALLGRQIERLRDAFVYERPALDIEELRRLRERQFAAKAGGKRLNAKFSPGALVDLEYYTQILQVTHGAGNPRLRTPRMHEVLDALARAGTLTRDEGQRLIEAYYFLRHLINGLRMLRGHAQDLFLPDPDSIEYAHLARRMGYGFAAGATEADRRHDLPPARKLMVDFETGTAVVRAFIERHFGREHLPDPAHGNMADLVLSDAPPPALAARVLARTGFHDQTRALYNIRKLAGTDARRRAFSKIAVVAADALALGPDPDMALNNWEQFVAILPNPGEHYDVFLRQPRRLDMLLALFAGSQFLADTLVRTPEFFDWITDPEKLLAPRSAEAIHADIHAFAPLAAPDFDDAIRKFRRREILRIGTRDICLHAPLEEVVADLSLLADTMIRHMLAHVSVDDNTSPEHNFCIIALGKLGGSELNYSSDIDLIALCANPPGPDTASEKTLRPCYSRWMERLCRGLSAHTREGYAYRVDLRLRPHGSASSIVHAFDSVLDYYRAAAAPWELQALLKARPIAGDLSLGQAFLESVRPVALARLQAIDIVAAIAAMRAKSEHNEAHRHPANIKTGRGGIRDVEFLVQGLQLIHGHQHPSLWEGHTLRALHRLRTLALIPHDTAQALRQDYVLLRRVEHWLQILEDRQTHQLPDSMTEQTALARRLYGPEGSADRLATDITAARDRIRTTFDAWINT